MELTAYSASNITWCLKQKGYEAYWVHVENTYVVVYVIKGQATTLITTWEDWEKVSESLNIPLHPWVWRDAQGRLGLGSMLLTNDLVQSFKNASQACRESRRDNARFCTCVACSVAKFIKTE